MRQMSRWAREMSQRVSQRVRQMSLEGERLRDYTGLNVKNLNTCD